MSIRGLARALGDLLFPVACAVCRQIGNGPICESCRQEFRLIRPPFCVKCGRPLPQGATACVGINCCKLHFTRARSAAVYEGSMREAVHALKFGRQRRVAEPLGDLMADVAAGDRLLSASLAIVPVPLHRSRLATRGFNQAELIARAVAARLGLPLRVDLLHRVGNSAPQSTLAAAARKANVVGSFVAAESTEGLSVLVVDDVLSTGATASECARVLLAAGSSRVTVLTAAAALLT